MFISIKLLYDSSYDIYVLLYFTGGLTPCHIMHVYRPLPFHERDLDVIVNYEVFIYLSIVWMCESG